MLIKEFNKMDQEISKDIRELEETCNRFDGVQGKLELDTALNFNKEMNTIFMLYKEDRLISALTLFVLTDREAEVSAMTLPEYRGQGYFSELVKKAEVEVKKYGIPSILFTCDARSESGKAAIASQKAEYEFSEYLLKYNEAFDKKVLDYDYTLKLHKAGYSDIEDIARISMDAFGDSYENAKSIASNMLSSTNREFFLGETDGQYVCMGTKTVEGDTASINGLGVLSAFQGKGYGREMLYLIIKKLLEQKVSNIVIEVESQNDRAFNLYKNSGFDVQTAWEYYRKQLK